MAGKISELPTTLSDFEEESIFNMDETGLFFKLFSERLYVLPTKNRKFVQGTKDMKAKSRVSIYVCTNAAGTLKDPLAFIGKAKNPLYFRKRNPPVAYFCQKSTW